MITPIIFLVCWAVVGIFFYIFEDSKEQNVKVEDILIAMAVGSILGFLVPIIMYWPRNIMKRVVIKKRVKK